MGERYDLVIVGMGSAGMLAAEFALNLGLRTAAVERARVGGGSLWSGCVPSKALQASARVAHTLRTADRYGLPAVRADIDTAAVWERLRRVQEEIAATDDDPQRFEDMGLDLVEGVARLSGPETVVVATDGGEAELETRFVLLATGSRPAIPDLAGLADVEHLTSEGLFARRRPPASLVIVGGGPTGTELAQATSRLGIRTTLLEREGQLLPREEPELVAVLERRLHADGVDVCTDVDLERVATASGRTTVHGSQSGAARSWSAAAVLVATGRDPNVEGLGLDEVGVEVGSQGVVVDDRLRSSVPTIYAAGDVAGRHLVAHAAAYEAVRAVRDMFFPGKGKANEAVPWCTFTDPELAHAGLTSAEAGERHGDDIHVWRQDLVHSDRARADGATEGAVVVVTARNRIVGAHVLAPHAGEMIHELALAIREGVSLSTLGGMVHVYPTYATAIGELAAEAALDRTESFRWLVRKGRG